MICPYCDRDNVAVTSIGESATSSKRGYQCNDCGAIFYCIYVKIN